MLMVQVIMVVVETPNAGYDYGCDFMLSAKTIVI